VRKTDKKHSKGKRSKVWAMYKGRKRNAEPAQQKQKRRDAIMSNSQEERETEKTKGQKGGD